MPEPIPGQKLPDDHSDPDDHYDPILQFFSFGHLPAHLGQISRPFHDLAVWITVNLPRNPERTVALRKLLEAKDAAVRANLFRMTV